MRKLFSLQEPICVVCPTRDRPEEFMALAESFVKTSTRATLVAYVDEDQPDLYAATYPERVVIHVDRRLGPVHSVNRICDLYRGPGIYGIAPDDSRFLIPGWDEYVLEEFEQMPGRLGVLSASHDQGDYVNLPYVSREWIELVGWFAYPEAYHFIWDTVLEMIGEATKIVYSDPARFKMHHGYLLAANKSEHYQKDATSFLIFCVNDRREIVKRIRAAMEAHAKDQRPLRR